MSRPVERLDTTAMTVAERQQAIAGAAKQQPSGRHQARKVEASVAPTRCHTCGHIDTTPDQGQAMDRHIEREHDGLGASSLVITQGVKG